MKKDPDNRAVKNKARSDRTEAAVQQQRQEQGTRLRVLSGQPQTQQHAPSGERGNRICKEKWPVKCHSKGNPFSKKGCLFSACLCMSMHHKL